MVDTHFFDTNILTTMTLFYTKLDANYTYYDTEYNRFYLTVVHWTGLFESPTKSFQSYPLATGLCIKTLYPKHYCTAGIHRGRQGST